MTVRAVLCSAVGEAPRIAVQRIETQAAGPGEVEIEVAAAALNGADLVMLAGRYQDMPSLPFVPGLEVAGRVVGGDKLPLGTRVLAVLRHGGFAERVVTHDAIPIPDSMPFDIAAGFAIAYGTAYGALVWRAALQPGETVAVFGAAGGVGLAAVELASVLGARVIAAAGSSEKCDIARAHGAQETIDYSRENLRERLKALAPSGVDVILDPIGGDAFDAAVRAVAWEGRIITLGFTTGRVPSAPANLLLVKNAAVLGLYWGAYLHRDPERFRQQFQPLFEMYEAGRLRPRVSAKLTFERAQEAFDLLATRRATGKIILVPPPSESADTSPIFHLPGL